MTIENINNLKTILETLEPSSDLYKTTKETIEFLSEEKHYLFGIDICIELDKGGIEGAIEYANEDGGYAVYTHSNLEPPLNLALEMEGWERYYLLSPEEYKQFMEGIN